MNSRADILHEILGSRRLLAEHVECLQLVADEVDASRKLAGNSGGQPPVRHLVRSALVSGVSVLAAAGCVSKCIIRKLPATHTITISLASTACAIYAIRRFRQQLHHRTQLRQIRRLIATLEAFDVALRQRLKYIREAQLLASSSPVTDESLHEVQRGARLRSYTATTITAAMPAIWATYAAIQRLEALPLASDYVDLYQPTESLDNCELLQLEPAINCTAQHVRDAQEIFQFLQSQLLVRLGLAVVCNADEAAEFLADDAGRLVGMLEAQRHFLVGQQRDWQQRRQLERRLEAMRAERQASAEHSQTAAMVGLRYTCGDVLARMLALAEELGAIEAAMEGAQQADAESQGWAERLMLLESPLERFAERLEACRDESQRMLCQYHRLVHGDRRQQVSGVPQTDVGADDLTVDVRRFEERAAEEQRTVEAEFYALAEGGEEGAEDETGHEDNKHEQLEEKLAELSTGIVKREFRPVLRQLRDRLEPINEAMRQRERSFLVAKGIAVDEEKQAANSGSDEDDDMDAKPKRKDLYADSRQFLQDKQPVGFFAMQGFPLPAHRAMEEEILE